MNVYVWVPTEEVLMTDGDQVPFIDGELFELKGKMPDIEFRQYGPSCANSGVIGADTTTVMVADSAHCPGDGVKVYIEEPGVDVFTTAGDQVPLIDGEFVEFGGNIPGVSF